MYYFKTLHYRNSCVQVHDQNFELCDCDVQKPVLQYRKLRRSNLSRVKDTRTVIHLPTVHA